MSDDSSNNEKHLVVTGSSAGGIEALSTLVASLPADFPAPIVVAQHLDPKVASSLAQILQRHTALPVKSIEEAEQLVPGQIFVVPSNKHVAVTDSKVTVSVKGPPGARPSVDLLFASAAQTFGDRLIAIVLSGMGSDGALGARAVKKQGGTVIIQDPETSLYPSMPLALPRTAVDIVARTETIGPLLKDLIEGVYAPTDLEEDAIRGLLQNVRDESGIDFSNYKRSTITRRLSRMMASSGFHEVGDYIEYLKRTPEARQRLVSGFLIKVTEFFRDAEVFDELRATVLPTLIDEARSNRRELRIWSAGCATGEEAYSLAIMIAELTAGNRVPTRIFATDIDADAVSFARHGVYTGDAVDPLGDELLQKYFTPRDGTFEVTKAIRSMVVFGQHDLGQRAPFPRVDLTLCRNVLIYFTKELQQRALHLFAYSLRPGGYLALGKSETATPLPEYFEPVQSSVKLYRRRGDRVRMPLPDVRSASVSPRLGRQPLPNFMHAPADRIPARSSTAEQLGNHLLRSPFGLTIIDRHYDIRAMNNAARDLFNIRTVGSGEDLLHLLAPAASTKLRTLIDATFRNERTDVAGLELAIRGDIGEDRFVRIWSIAGEHSGTGIPQTIALLAIDATAEVKQRGDLEKEAGGLRRAVEEMTVERMDLLTRQRAVIDANSELSEFNTELLANNERLTANVEDAESSTEEIETLNEEMQATNEELETLNEELQATIEELNTTNDELEARAVELEHAAVVRESERQVSEVRRDELAGVLDAIPDAICYFDQDGGVAFANQAYRDFAARMAEGTASISFEGHKVDLAEVAERLTRRPTVDLEINVRGVEHAPRAVKAKAVRREAGRGLLVIYNSSTA